MSRFKMVTGICLMVQAFAFFAMLFVSATNKKKRATALALIAAGTGIAGAYLLMKGAEEYVPHNCCEQDSDDEIVEDGNLEDIDCSFSDEDFIADAAEEI